MSFRERSILIWFLKVKESLAAFLKFYSNWLRLITLCENITPFWSRGPDCLREHNSHLSVSHGSESYKLFDPREEFLARPSSK